MLISHVGDLLIYGSDSAISYLSGRLGSEYGFKVSAVNGSIYLGMNAQKLINEFIKGGDIFDGARTFPGVTLSSNNYADRIQDISILPRRAKLKGRPLTEEEQFASRSELRVCACGG